MNSFTQPPAELVKPTLEILGVDHPDSMRPISDMTVVDKVGEVTLLLERAVELSIDQLEVPGDN